MAVVLLKGRLTVTANRTVFLPLAGTSPSVLVHLLPALLFGLHNQPLVLSDDAKTVLAGTVSVIIALGAVTLPTFVYTNVYVIGSPGFTVVGVWILVTAKSGVAP